MLALIQRCGTFWVLPQTPIHLWQGKWAAQPLITNLNSQTSLLEKCSPILKAKLNLKPKHFHECLYSLKCHLPNLSHPSFPLFSHSFALLTSDSTALVGTCVCSHRQAPAPWTGWDQNCRTAKLYVLDLLYCKGKNIIHVAYKTLGSELLEQYI